MQISYKSILIIFSLFVVIFSINHFVKVHKYKLSYNTQVKPSYYEEILIEEYLQKEKINQSVIGTYKSYTKSAAGDDLVLIWSFSVGSVDVSAYYKNEYKEADVTPDFNVKANYKVTGSVINFYNQSGSIGLIKERTPFDFNLKGDLVLPLSNGLQYDLVKLN